MRHISGGVTFFGGPKFIMAPSVVFIVFLSIFLCPPTQDIFQLQCTHTSSCGVADVYTLASNVNSDLFFLSLCPPCSFFSLSQCY